VHNAPPTAFSGIFETYVYRVLDAPITPVFFPDHPSKAKIAYTAVGVSPLASVGPAVEAALSVGVRTNPARGSVAFRAEGLRGGYYRAEVYDVSGRLIRRLEEGRTTAANRVIAWEGIDVSGNRVRSGVYVMRLDQAGRRAACRFVYIR
jgi:hypothetical protein